MSSKSYAVVLLIAAASCLAPAASAATIIEVTGPNGGRTGFTQLNQTVNLALGVGFSTSEPYTNAAISVVLAAFSEGGDYDLSAYLTTQLGPGTTAASHEVASATSRISIPVSSISPEYTLTSFTVLSGLSLPAGNYYLTYGGAPVTATAWAVGTAGMERALTTSPGTSLTASSISTFISGPYIPAHIFQGYPDYYFWFSVTGDPVGAAVPEPSAFGLCLGGILALAVARLRRG